MEVASKRHFESRLPLASRSLPVFRYLGLLHATVLTWIPTARSTWIGGIEFALLSR